jgi:nicotinamide mononucleotide transporter
MSYIEIVASAFGLACVWFTVKQNVWCWPTGLIQVILYIWIFYNSHLYSDMLLQIVFVFISIYGWYHWIHGNRETSVLEVTKTGNEIVIWMIIGLAGTFMLGFLMGYYTNAALPYPDSFITVASLIAQWLMARKKLESWWFWIMVDVVGIGVYFFKELYFTTGLYSVFLVMAVMGYIDWKRSLIPSLQVK